jgi:hypothetical protein
MGGRVTVGALPAFLLTHRMVVEPYLGASGNGPTYGRPVEVACFVEPARSTARGGETRTAIGSATVYAPLDTVISPESRVTLEGRRVEVVSVVRHDGGGLPTPDHVEIVVQ